MADHGLTWGVLPAGTFERLLVFSPHFDDAAMGAGHLLLAHPGSTVVTVFAGRPARYPAEPTEWDALGGFRAGDDVVAIRRTEDEAALAVLGAEHRWLEFVDHQYLEPEERATPEQMAPALETRDRRGATDRGRAAAGARQPRPRGDARRRDARRRDAARTHLVRLRGRRLQAHPRHAGVAGVEALPVRLLADADDRARRVQDHARKRTAIECYRSQLGPLYATTRSPNVSTAACPSSSGCSRLRPPAGSGCATL